MTNEKYLEISESICGGRRCSGSCGDYSDSGGELDYAFVYVYYVHRVREV